MSDEPTLQFPPTPEPPESHRRTRRIAVLAALAALVLLLPIATYLLLRNGGGQSTPPGSAMPSPTPPATAPATTSPPVTASPSRAPDGRIPLDTLGNSTLTIPPWPADNVRGPSGRVRFHDGVHTITRSDPADAHRPPTGTQLAILAVTYGDVDRDGADETVAEIGCLIEGGSKQLVAFDRNTSGRIITMGQVVATTGEIRDVRDGSARVGADGVITVRLGDYQGCCDDQTPQSWQDRGYRWHKGRFAQVNGPTRMTVNRYVTETSMATGELVLGPAVDGYRYGTLTVTIRHRWGTRPGHLVVEFYPSPGLERAGTAWPPVTTPPTSPGFTVTVNPPAARGTITHTFAFRRPATLTGGTLDLEVSGKTTTVTRLAEANPWNNGATATIRTVN
jgi:hypothetical protein